MPWAEPATPPAEPVEPVEAELRRRLDQIERNLAVLLEAVELAHAHTDENGLVVCSVLLRARPTPPEMPRP